MVTVEALREQLELYLGWSYSAGDPRYPSTLPVVRLPSSPPRQTNCCAFVEGLIVGAAVRDGTNVPWGLGPHKRAMIYSAGDRFGPVEALIAAGLADVAPVESNPPPQWSVCQGWSGARGHTFIVRDVHGDRVLILEANNAHKLQGVGWRGLGMASSSSPPAMWHRDPMAWTWQRIRRTYPEMAIAALRI